MLPAIAENYLVNHFHLLIHTMPRILETKILTTDYKVLLGKSWLVLKIAHKIMHQHVLWVIWYKFANVGKFNAFK